MKYKNGSRYASSTPIPSWVLAIMAVVMLAFFIVGLGGFVLFLFYMTAIASLVWVAFASYGPLVGLIAFIMIVGFFAVIGGYGYKLLTCKIDKRDPGHDRGRNHDSY